MAKARYLKFNVRIHFDECDSKNAKLGDKGAWPTSHDLLFNFGTPSMSLERLKIETWNLVCRYMRTIQSIQKLQVQMTVA